MFTHRVGVRGKPELPVLPEYSSTAGAGAGSGHEDREVNDRGLEGLVLAAVRAPFPLA